MTTSPGAGERRPRRHALVGTGHRAQLYVDALLGSHRDTGALVALVDPNVARIAYYQDLARAAGLPHPTAYSPDRFAEMVRRERPTTVIVTTVDRWHADYVVAALDLGCSVICEKPLTIDAEGCRRIVAAAQRSTGRVVVTFNYRYSPRNSAVKRLLVEGAIGDVTSVHFEWALDTVHGADYFRRWHRDKASSGGLLVHKSTHHFDLLNWWLDDVPRTVYAQGELAFYGAQNAAARGLGVRPPRGHGAQTLGDDPFLLDLEADPRLRRLYLDAESRDGYLRDQDVFAEGISIEDNLAVLARYRRGALLTYSLNAHAPWEGYRVSINGTAGRLELDVCERADTRDLTRGITRAVADGGERDHGAVGVRGTGDRLLVQRHWCAAEQVDVMALARRDALRPLRGPGLGGGQHGGGDALLLDDVLRGTDVVGPDPLGRAAGYLDGVRSVLVGVAANRSLQTRAPVDLVDLGVQFDPPAPEHRPLQR